MNDDRWSDPTTSCAHAAPWREEQHNEAGEAAPMATAYAGPERRRHRVYVTRNTEYHVRDAFCVAVRDRRTGEFMHGHLAIFRQVQGGLRFFENGAIGPNPGEPRAGESIYFAGDGRELVTSPLEAVARPTPEVVRDYPAAERAGLGAAGRAPHAGLGGAGVGGVGIAGAGRGPRAGASK